MNNISVSILLICLTIEQIFYISGTVWLIEYRGWSLWCALITVLLVGLSSPSIIVKLITKAMKD